MANPGPNQVEAEVDAFRAKFLHMIRSSLAVAGLLVSLSLPVSAAEFVLDKPHTQAEFVAVHLAISQVHGQIPLISGTATIGPNDLPTEINATFDLTSLITNDANRDKTLRESYFEVTKYPTMTFVEREAKGTPAAFTLTGDLTIHGVTKSVTLKSQMIGSAVIKGKKQIGYSGTTTIDRRDFGMTFGPLLDGALIVSNQVTINVETDAIEQ
jgi:polyisoprenoid-binding protein YceI